VAIAGSIVFHNFGVWAGYQAQKISGFKFEEGDAFSEERSRLIRTAGTSVLNDPVRKREEREAKKQAALKTEQSFEQFGEEDINI